MQGPRPQHEFTREENQIVGELATWSGGLGILKLMQTGLGLVGGNVIGAAIELTVALALLGGHKALRKAVDTAGNDVDHLMVAVDKLATVFLLRIVLSLVAAVLLGAVAVIVAFVFGMSGALELN